VRMLIRKPRVAFQGERGAFSEEAAMKLLGNEIELVPRKTFADLFNSLDERIADYVLAPVENTIAGLVHPSVDLMQSSSLAVLDEVVIKIEQHLIGFAGASFDAIETVQRRHDETRKLDQKAAYCVHGILPSLGDLSTNHSGGRMPCLLQDSLFAVSPGAGRLRVP